MAEHEPLLQRGRETSGAAIKSGRGIVKYSKDLWPLRPSVVLLCATRQTIPSGRQDRFRSDICSVVN